MASTSWVKDAIEGLKARNTRESTPFKSLIASHSQLWYENSRLQRQQNELKHRIGSFQHEISALLRSSLSPPTPSSSSSSSTPSSSSTSKVNHTELEVLLLRGLQSLQEQLYGVQATLREKAHNESYERKTRLDLSKRVREQQLLLSHQAEEQQIAKSMIASLQKENAELIDHILREKSLKAEAHNEEVRHAEDRAIAKS